jgi:hypothetical protein
MKVRRDHAIPGGISHITDGSGMICRTISGTIMFSQVGFSTINCYQHPYSMGSGDRPVLGDQNEVAPLSEDGTE